ncbi:MAG: hypothetical protein NTU49_04395, partial [Gammaproteobacteria bacterium]|nr:hypothetical protein [Gammaproteobacteria bacterium]
MHTQLLAYNKNSAELFSHFVHLPFAIFFDSCKAAQEQGRYDIIVAAPSEIIKGDIFPEIKAALNTLKNKTHSENKYN